MNGRAQVTRMLMGMLVLMMTLAMGATNSVEAAEPKKFTLINVVFDGTKIWLPGTIIVNQGDEVELTLIIS